MTWASVPSLEVSMRLLGKTTLLSWLVEHDPISIEPLTDDVIDKVGYDPRSPYAELFWLPVIGPSSLLLLRRLADWLDHSPAGFPLAIRPAAAELGLGHNGGTNSPMVRTLGRLVIFQMADVVGDTYRVRRTLPPLARRHILRLPPHLAMRHNSNPFEAARIADARQPSRGATRSGKPGGPSRPEGSGPTVTAPSGRTHDLWDGAA
jgi:hypothetical protein